MLSLQRLCQVPRCITRKNKLIYGVIPFTFWHRLPRMRRQARRENCGQCCFSLLSLAGISSLGVRTRLVSVTLFEWRLGGGLCLRLQVNKVASKPLRFVPYDLEARERKTKTGAKLKCSKWHFFSQMLLSAFCAQFTGLVCTATQRKRVKESPQTPSHSLPVWLGGGVRLFFDWCHTGGRSHIKGLVEAQMRSTWKFFAKEKQTVLVMPTHRGHLS